MTISKKTSAAPQPDRTFGHMDLNYFSFAAEVRLTMGNNYRDL